MLMLRARKMNQLTCEPLLALFLEWLEAANGIFLKLLLAIGRLGTCLVAVEQQGGVWM